MNLADLHTELLGSIGVAGTTPGQRIFLLNEGYRELIVQGEWMKKTVECGPTVADQQAYTLPAAISQSAGERILNLSVDGQPYDLASRIQGEQLDLNDLNLVDWGVYWISFASDGTEQLSLWPTPGTAGLSISATAIVEPDALSTPTDIPLVPARFHRAIVDYAASKAVNDMDLRSAYEVEFRARAEDLRKLRRSRAGGGPRQIRVMGWTA